MSKRLDLLSQMDPVSAERWVYDNVTCRRPQDVAERLFYAEAALKTALRERSGPFSGLRFDVAVQDMPMDATVKTVVVSPGLAILRIDVTDFGKDAEKKLRYHGAMLAEAITSAIRDQVKEYLPERGL